MIKYNKMFIKICLICLFEMIPIFKSNAQATDTSVISSVEMIGEGVVSTEKSEYKSVFYNHGKNLMFTRSEANFKGQVIMISEMKNGKWQMAKPISFSDILYDDSDPFISASGKILYFVSNRPRKGFLPEKSLDIWKSTFNNGIWGKPVPLDKTINSEKNELSPFLFKDKLYFISNRDSGIGFLDIYSAEIKNGKYLKPVNMGDKINSKMNEFSPYISADGKYLAFTSWRKTTCIGQSDIYFCLWQNGKWSEPVNAGSLVNSKFEESCPVFSEDLEYFYFSSNRYDDSLPLDQNKVLNGSFNIYRIPMKEIFKNIKFE